MDRTQIKQRVRQLRKMQTRAEAVFWDAVRNRRFKNEKFLRQYPIVFDWEDRERLFIADFYCAEHKLVVEIDGRIHDKQFEYDQLRELIITELGYKVIRFKNEEIEGDLTGALKRMERELAFSAPLF